mmetsp:Transcript_35715/g.83044  ORF Transcript_35715/g.83044 Transcript_35715/m.83044 type:complete len:268 (-) Transcript_35715:3676-4479(-)
MHLCIQTMQPTWKKQRRCSAPRTFPWNTPLCPHTNPCPPKTLSSKIRKRSTSSPPRTRNPPAAPWKWSPAPTIFWPFPPSSASPPPPLWPPRPPRDPTYPNSNLPASYPATNPNPPYPWSIPPKTGRCSPPSTHPYASDPNTPCSSDPDPWASNSTGAVTDSYGCSPQKKPTMRRTIDPCAWEISYAKPPASTSVDPSPTKCGERPLTLSKIPGGPCSSSWRKNCPRCLLPSGEPFRKKACRCRLCHPPKKTLEFWQKYPCMKMHLP